MCETSFGLINSFLLLQASFIQPCFVLFKGNNTFFALFLTKCGFLYPSIELRFFHISICFRLIQALIGSALLLEYRVFGDFSFCLSVSTDFPAGVFFTIGNEVTVSCVSSSGGNKQHAAVLALPVRQSLFLKQIISICHSNLSK